MKRAIIVALREVRTYLQDKGDLAFSLLLPIAIFAVIYGAFGGQTQFNGTAYIVNQDTGTYSKDLLDRLDKINGLSVSLITPEKASSELSNSSLLLVTYIPPDFSANLTAGQPVGITIKQRGNGGTDGQIVASLIGGEVERINRTFQVETGVENLLAGKSIPQAQIQTTVQKFLAKEDESPLVGVSETTIGSSPDPVNQFLPGIIGMFVLFAISLSSQVIVDERKKGTLERLLTTRLTKGELFAGKFLSGVSRGFVQTLILLILAYIVFQMFTPLSFLQVLVVALVFSAAASAVGLVIAAISRTSDQAVWISVVFTNVSVILGGTFFAIPKTGVFAVLSKLSVNTYVNNALVGLIGENQSLANESSNILVLAGVAVVALLVGRLLFRPVPGGGR